MNQRRVPPSTQIRPGSQKIANAPILPQHLGSRILRRKVAKLAPRHRLVDRPLWVFAILLTVLIAGACGQLRAEPSKAGIVGLDATTCRQFNEDVRSSPSIRRDYLAWAQGFMSGILLGRPPGVDEGLDLNPATFDRADQMHFLEDHCDQNT
jgi:hypothetical protein